MTDAGTFIDHGGRPAVRFERTYGHPVDRVWQAVTAPDEVSRWFPSSVVFEPRVGGAVSFSGDANVDDRNGTVLTYEPPRRFAFTWGDNEVHLALTPTGSGCTLELVNVLGVDIEAARNAAGWTVCVARLDALITGGPLQSQDWQTAYDEYVAAGLPSGADVPH